MASIWTKISIYELSKEKKHLKKLGLIHYWAIRTLKNSGPRLFASLLRVCHLGPATTNYYIYSMYVYVYTMYCFVYKRILKTSNLAPLFALWTHRLRNYKDTNPYTSSLLVFRLGWCRNFVGSETGQKQSVKLLQNMVYNPTQHPPTLPPTATHCLYILYVYFGRGGGMGEIREKVEGQQFTRGVENTNMTDCISSL